MLAAQAPPSPRLVPVLVGSLAALVLLAGSAAAAVGPWQANDQSRVRLISRWEVAPRSGELRLGLEFRIIPGWHVYWKNSGDAGFPPSLDFSPTPELSETELLWPAPNRYELRGGLVSFGYETHVVYPVTAQIEAPAGDRLTLAAELDYLVCEEDCIPYRYRLTLEQGLAAAGGTAVPGEEAPLLDLWWKQVPRPVDEVAGMATEGELAPSGEAPERLLIALTGAGARANGPGPDVFFEPQELFELGRPEVDVGEERLRFTIPLERKRVGEALPPSVELAWTVTGLAAVDPAAGDVRAVEARRRIATGVPAQVDEGGPAAARPSPPPFLMGALGGGLLLGLTPTALAVLLAQLLAVGSLALRGDAGLVTAARRCAATAAGIFLGFWSLTVFALTSSRGAVPVTWGMQLQEPVLLAALVTVACLLALNLWGLLDLPFRHGGPNAPGPAGGGLLAGLAVAFLSLAWNVPWLGQAASSALMSGALTAFLAATVVAGGLALPYLLLAFIPALPRLLRRPARHLPEGTSPDKSRFVELLGFLVLAAVLWLLYLLTGRLSPEGLALVELLLILIGLLAWLRHEAKRRWWSTVLAVLLLLAALMILDVAAENRPPPAASATSATS